MTERKKKGGKKMKYHEKVKTRIDCGNYPQYETQKSKFLWVDDSIYDCPTNLEKVIPGTLLMKEVKK